MFRSFRKARQKITGKGSAKAYFLSVVGEILLVVIGILIALQVDQWYENYQNDQWAAKYRIQLIKEISQDTIRLDRLIQEAQLRKQTAVRYLRHYDLPQPSTDSLNFYFNQLVGLGGYSTFVTHTQTIEQLVSTGKIEVLEEIEKRKILEYRAGNEQLNAAERANSEFVGTVRKQFTAATDGPYNFGLTSRQHPIVGDWQNQLDSEPMRLRNNIFSEIWLYNRLIERAYFAEKQLAKALIELLQ